MDKLEPEVAKNFIKDARILLIDDHRNIRVSLRLTLEGEGAIVDEAATLAEGLTKIGITRQSSPLPYDLILLDIRLPDGNGLDILKKLSETHHASQVIMISGEGTVKEAFEATQAGAFDYVEKPFNPERILVSVGRCLDFNKIASVNTNLKKQILRGQEIIGEHESLANLRNLVEKVGRTNGRVLILGESGTGKELIAKSVHRHSARSDKPLVKVNCAAIPHSLVESELFGHEKGAFTGATKSRKGLFEQANNGTLFLDEIGELDLNVQAKLLRVLQSGELVPLGSETPVKVDVRLLCATHRDLEGMIQNGEFREDLYYRLNVVTLKAPPLRERGSDVVLLAKHFIQEACEENSVGYRTLGDKALDQLKAHHWPGNIRELKNVIERVVILSEEQLIDYIPDLKPAGRVASEEKASSGEEAQKTQIKSDDGTFHMEMNSEIVPWQEFHQDMGRKYLKFVLNKTGGNVSEAARLLCLERAYLHRLMKKLGIQRGVVVSA